MDDTKGPFLRLLIVPRTRYDAKGRFGPEEVRADVALPPSLRYTRHLYF